MDPIVIIGTGLAGYTLAREVRKRDRATSLLLVTADDGAFYSKPMLSNALAKGKQPAQLITADAGKMAQELAATVLTHTRVESVDHVARRFRAEGLTYAYRALVLAVGARPMRLPLTGDGADQVHSVNNLGDYARFHAAVAKARRVAVIGPGLIGCEFANDLLAAGKQVTVIGPGPYPLARLLPPRIGEAVHRTFCDAGIQWRLGTGVRAVTRVADGLRLTLEDGSDLETEVVISAVGLQPDLGLAQQMGVTTARGICVDGQLQTSASHLYALGDCAEVNGQVLPFVLPIMEQARVLAAVLCGAEATVAYPPMPVVVKTPACPLVVASPDAHLRGEWHVTALEGGMRGEYRVADRLHGYVLVGSATAARQSLTRELSVA